VIDALFDFRENLFLSAAGAVLGLAILCAMFRMVVGPSMADRIVALDLLGFFAASIIAVYAIRTDQEVVLSVAIVMALILFLGTAAFAKYLERRATSEILEAEEARS
jgi:multicomponent Na+:H+ antiporter subunit F